MFIKYNNLRINTNFIAKYVPVDTKQIDFFFFDGTSFTMTLKSTLERNDFLNKLDQAVNSPQGILSI